MTTKSFNFQTNKPDCPRQSRVFRYGIAVLAVICAGLSIHYLPVIGDWGRGALLLFFFANILVTQWLGLRPGLVALTLSLIGINSLLLAPVWRAEPYDALFLNTCFCLLSAVIIILIHYYHKQTLTLRERQQDMDLAQAVAQVGSWRFKTHGNELYWSDEKYRIFEIAIGAKVNIDTFFSAIHPDDREYVDRMWQASLRGEPYDIEHRIIIAGGKVKWIREKAILDFAKDGALIGGFGTTQDISERKKSEQELLDREKKLQLIMDLTPNLICYLGTDYRYVQINKTYETWWNKAPGQILGHEVREIIGEQSWSFIHPYMARAMAGETVSFEYKSDAYRWVQIDYVPDIDAAGIVRGIVVQVANITEHKLAEQKLIEQENQLRLIMNLTPALISYLDTDLRYLRANQTYEDWYGISVKDIIGLKVREIVGEKTWTIAQPYLGRACAGEKASFEHQLRFNNNVLRWSKASFVPDIDASGVVKGIVVHVADIEDRKQAERALQDSEQRTHLATEATGVGIWQWNVLTNQILWDDQMFRIFGIPPTQDMCVNYSVWSNAVLPEDLPKQEEIMQETIRTAGHSSREYRMQRPDRQGVHIIAAVETVRTNDQGEVEWVVGTNLDITERKIAELALLERENELRLIINSMPALIAYVGTDFRYKRANSAYLEWLGIPIENIIGFEVKDVVGETAWQRIKPYMEMAMSGEQLHYELEMPYKTAKSRWIHANYVPDKDSNGNVKGIISLIIDIEEIKLAELEITKLNKSLLHRVEELQAIFDTAPIGLAITDDSGGKHIRGNPALEKMIGLPPFTDLSIRNNYPKLYKAYQGGRELDVADLPMQKAIRDEKVENQIFDIERPDGQTITFMCNAVPLYDEKREPRGAVGAFMDITRLKQTEIDLKSSEERLRLSQNAGHLGIFDQNLTSGEMQWDKRLRELWGVGPDETLVTETCMLRVHPDDRARVYAAVKRSLDPEGNGNYHAEYRIIRPTDNQIFWVAAFGTTSFDNGRPTRLVGFVQDISDRKHTEELLYINEIRLSIAMDALRAGFWEWEREGNKTFFSPVWKKQLGYEDHELPNLHEEWENRLHPDDRDYIFKTVEHYLNNFMPSYMVEFRLRHKDGSYRWIQSRAGLTYDQNNQLIRMAGIHLDITDDKKAKELNQQHDKMEETFRLNIASQTLAAIAHELNQPLTAISYFADVAVDMVQTGNKNPEKLADILENCSSQAQRAGQVIRQLLSILQKSDVQNELVDINKMVNFAYEYFKANKQLNSFEIKMNLAEELLQVLADTLQIQKVLINLISNSLEAMQENGNHAGTVTITTRVYPDDASMAQVTVHDTGTGVADANMLSEIFQPFYTTKSTGLGMGLAISRAMIEAHGGKMWAVQNPDIGISIHFTLPLAP